MLGLERGRFSLCQPGKHWPVDMLRLAVLPRCLASGLFEQAIHALDMRKPRRVGNLLDRKNRLTEQFPHPSRPDTVDLFGRQVTGVFREPALQRAARDAEMLEDCTDRDPFLTGLFAHEAYCLDRLSIAQMQEKSYKSSIFPG